MLTRNFISAYKAVIDHVNNLGFGGYPFKSLDGSISYADNSLAAASILIFKSTTDLRPTYNGNTKYGGLCVIAIGSGSTPATADDYTMEAEISEGVEVLTQTTALNSTFSRDFASISRRIRNTSDSPITIREVGLISRGKVGGQYQFTPECLIAREVLSEPITIYPGKKKNITIDLCVD